VVRRSIEVCDQFADEVPAAGLGLFVPGIHEHATEKKDAVG
jgi:hypothetical protein